MHTDVGQPAEALGVGRQLFGMVRFFSEDAEQDGR